MDVTLVYSPDEAQLTAWNQFLDKHPERNIFQSPEYFAVNKQTKNSEPFCLLAMENGTVKGLVSGTILANYGWPLKALTKRAIVQGGPLVDPASPETYDLLIAALRSKLKRKAIYLQVRNMRDTDKEAFQRAGYTYEPHLDILIDLQPEVDVIEQRIQKNKRRNVTKSYNKGVVFRTMSDLSELEDGMRLIRNTYRRVGLPLIDDSHFRSAFSVLHPQGKLKAFGAYHDQRLIGMRLTLNYGGLVYDWYAGSDEEEKNKYPNDVLPVGILFWAKENGYKTFDFGGAGKPDVPYGVREHKLKFGGELFEFGRYECILKPGPYKLSTFLFSLYKKLNGLR